MTNQQVPKVLVMMATYNGEQFLASQIDSILAQRDVDVTLMIRDDCSSDSTAEMCRQYAKEHSNVLFTQNETNLGVARNFMGMVYSAESDGFDFYAFSDQDDEWLPEKLSVAAKALLKNGRNDAAALYYSDIRNDWVDENDQCLRSELEISRFKGCESAPMTLLVRNWVNGCAMVFNNELRQLLLSYQPDAFPRIHDVWVHMVARYCGVVIPDYDSVLMRRRLTGSNVVGKTEMRIGSMREAAHLAKEVLFPSKHPMMECARLFMDGYSDGILPQYRKSFNDFLHYRDSLSNRVRIMRSPDYWLPSKAARVRMRVAMLLGFY